MLKGCQKQLVVLKTGENSVFESAWFVLREACNHVAYDDMIAEANRIVAGGLSQKYMRRRRFRGGVFWMLLGALLGGGLATLLFFII